MYCCHKNKYTLADKPKPKFKKGKRIIIFNIAFDRNTKLNVRRLSEGASSLNSPEGNIQTAFGKPVVVVGQFHSCIIIKVLD